MEMEVRRRMGKSTWKQYAFQITNSTHLQYFSKIDKVHSWKIHIIIGSLIMCMCNHQKPEEVVPLENILKVTSVDNMAETYQFKVFIERKKIPVVWTLKARTEASYYIALHIYAYMIISST